LPPDVCSGASCEAWYKQEASASRSCCCSPRTS
jgi:hypothetical protein